MMCYNISATAVAQARMGGTVLTKATSVQAVNVQPLLTPTMSASFLQEASYESLESFFFTDISSQTKSISALSGFRQLSPVTNQKGSRRH